MENKMPYFNGHDYTEWRGTKRHYAPTTAVFCDACGPSRIPGFKTAPKYAGCGHPGTGFKWAPLYGGAKNCDACGGSVDRKKTLVGLANLQEK